MSDLDKVRKRHSQIDQDALPGLELIGTTAVRDNSVERESHKAEKSVAWGKCPHHTPDPGSAKHGLTGLVAITRETYAFRQHTKRVGHVVVICPGSGQPGTPQEKP